MRAEHEYIRQKKQGKTTGRGSNGEKKGTRI
jgi:hypothetical protein